MTVGLEPKTSKMYVIYINVRKNDTNSYRPEMLLREFCHKNILSLAADTVTTN